MDMHVEKTLKQYSCCPQPFPGITYTISIERRPMFFVFNMLLPCCLITLVALLGKSAYDLTALAIKIKAAKIWKPCLPITIN